MEDELPRLLRSADRSAAVAMIDLDHFKAINDTCSHEAGDHVLRALGRLLQTVVHAADEAAGSFTARLGGEEFLVVLVGIDAGAAARRLDQLREAIGAHDWRPLTGDLPVTVSIGETNISPEADASQSVALGRADACLYRAKATGRNRLVVDEP